MSKGLIIIVEDDSVTRKLYAAGLTSAGYTVLTAASGEEGLAILSQHRPRVAILDIDLPGISGIEVCRRMRSMPAGNAPTIFITANDSVDILQTCVESGGDDFVVKGMPIRSILERVSYWARGGGRKLNEQARRKIVATTQDMIEELEVKGAQNIENSQASADLVRDRDVIRIRSIFERRMERDEHMRDNSVRGRMSKLGYVTGLVNAAARESLRMKIRFQDFLRAAMIACYVADDREVGTMVDNWHEFYGNPAFAEACVAGEADFESESTA